MPLLNTAQLSAKEPLPGWSGRFFHSEHMTFGYWEIAADAAPLHEHRHEQEEVWNIVDGEVIITVGEVEHIAGPGCAVIVPPGTPHSAQARGACHAIVVDYPLREQIAGISTAG